MSSDFLTKEAAYLFNRGEYHRAYERMGAQLCALDGTAGIHFALWAPHAAQVSVVGDFNQWDGSKHVMQVDETGIWCLFIPGLGVGERYKFQIETATGDLLYKCDPFAFYSELRPKTASITASLEGYLWKDRAWYTRKAKQPARERPMLIYEIHLGSWKRHPDGSLYSYTQLSEELIPYLVDMGYTHIELMPLSEHPFDGSWGYQTVSYFAATSRYGTPEELMHFVDSCHHAGIGVLMDWVPGHFCKDAHGLGLFDGSPLYEKEEHLHWGTYKFNFETSEVRGFLLSNALFWLDKFHIDGLRVDGVSSMIYLDFDRGHGAYAPNVQGGRENLHAISFLQELNRIVFLNYPSAIMIAEESTDWPMVTRPPYDGGLGFSFKWNMGWMNDTLKYCKTWFEDRPGRHTLLTFSMCYAFSEDFILPLSHDEVVHGKHALVDKMPGDNWQKFAGLRTLLLYQMTHPGKKLTFMGAEFAQYIEWRYYEQLEWFMLQYPLHQKFSDYSRALNHLYLSEKPLWEDDASWEGFEWLDPDNSAQAILSYLRRDKAGNLLLIVLNFRPQAYDEFRIGVPRPGRYRELFNSDAAAFGGAGLHQNTIAASEAKPFHGQEQSVVIKLPPLGGVILKLGKPRQRRVAPRTEEPSRTTTEQKKVAGSSVAARKERAALNSKQLADKFKADSSSRRGKHKQAPGEKSTG